jgi:predicted lipoprotein with Yx(FWY)xxD motif
VLSTGKPTAEKGAKAAKLGTTKRKDGMTQATYAGFPLYGYVKDTKPGDALGNNLDQFGAEWYALTPAGSKPKGS